MKFYGNGLVWDKENSKILCKFIDGELETDDEDIIDKLKQLGYFANEEIIEKSNYETMDWPELKKYATEKGISVYKKTKDDIIKSLKEQEG